MKTAISIPDAVYRRAEKVARTLGMTRSRLYTTAVEDYLRRHSDEQIVERLDEVHGTLQEAVDPRLAEMQLRSLAKERW